MVPALQTQPKYFGQMKMYFLGKCIFQTKMGFPFFHEGVQNTIETDRTNYGWEKKFKIAQEGGYKQNYNIFVCDRIVVKLKTKKIQKGINQWVTCCDVQIMTNVTEKF